MLVFLFILTVKLFQNAGNVSYKGKYAYNIVIAILSLALALNFLEAFKDMARVYRWRFLASGQLTVRETDMILSSTTVRRFPRTRQTYHSLWSTLHDRLRLSRSWRSHQPTIDPLPMLHHHQPCNQRNQGRTQPLRPQCSPRRHGNRPPRPLRQPTSLLLTWASGKLQRHPAVAAVPALPLGQPLRNQWPDGPPDLLQNVAIRHWLSSYYGSLEPTHVPARDPRDAACAGVPAQC